jgi:hypothetical protein
MESSIKTATENGRWGVVGNIELDDLRKNIWRAIHEHGKGLSVCDVIFVLGIINYELCHHVDDEKYGKTIKG